MSNFAYLIMLKMLGTTDLKHASSSLILSVLLLGAIFVARSLQKQLCVRKLVNLILKLVGKKHLVQKGK